MPLGLQDGDEGKESHRKVRSHPHLLTQPCLGSQEESHTKNPEQILTLLLVEYLERALSQRVVLETPTGTQILSSVPSMCTAPSGVAGSCLWIKTTRSDGGAPAAEWW